VTDVVQVAERQRFELVEDGERAVLTYHVADGVVTFEHTVVPSPMEGRGVGSRLAAAGIAWAREEGLAVVPQCPFVRAWLGKHPEAAEGLVVHDPA
jgi:predicted GNAT family acetyltransferase